MENIKKIKKDNGTNGILRWKILKKSRKIIVPMGY